MNTQTEEFSVSLSIFQDEIQLGLRVMKFLFVLSMLLGAVSTAQAQAPPQQYVYGSQPTTPTSSVISGFSKANQAGALSAVPGSPLNERFEGGLVAVDGQGRFVFVLNPTHNDISMFQIDQSTGALTEVPASPFAVPPTLNSNHAPTRPISITTEESGSLVFVGYYDGDFLGPYLYSLSLFGVGIHVYQIDQLSGNLTEISGSPFNGGMNGIGGASGIAISGNQVQALSGPASTIFPSTANFGSVTVGTRGPTRVFSIVNNG